MFISKYIKQSDLFTNDDFINNVGFQSNMGELNFKGT